MYMNNLISWLTSLLPKQIPTPSNSYEISDHFAEALRASLSQGSVSMGLGKMFTKEEHDRLYQSLKDYRFSD